MRICRTLALALLLSTACTNHYYLSSGLESHWPVERRSEREVCTVVLSDSTSYEATDVRMRGDRTTIRLVPTGDSLGVATREVESFTFTSRAMGAGHGALIGAAVGGGVGALFGLSIAGPGSGGWDTGGETSYLAGAAGGAVFFGGVGSVLGAVVGAGKGSGDVYHPYPKESPPSAMRRPAVQ